ncbi:hypothetical protein [Schauerella aestuarii]|uniref:hypothetical protein n=1 Tax=Schauerella aestuarii TaxID=2511204 RepID=UPI001369A919|nr:hypothetical protein [Achromobacter aestuarii]MYZ44228.1 hypothetical protein [Achromobacter aestuarii]
MTLTIINPRSTSMVIQGRSPQLIKISGGVPGPSVTPEQIAVAVAAYLHINPPTNGDNDADATDEQVAHAVAAFLQANPPAAGKDATDEQISEGIAAYFAANPLPESVPLRMKGEPNGVAELDGGGGLAQKMKLPSGGAPAAIRDTDGEGNGKASVMTASIATTGANTVLVKTGVWQSELDYAFRVFGTTAAGVVDITAYRTVISGSASYGFTNSGIVPVTVTFGVFADGYSGWAIQGSGFGRAQFIVTDAAVVGNGTGDPQVRDWSMYSAADTAALNSQVTVSRRILE